MNTDQLFAYFLCVQGTSAAPQVSTLDSSHLQLLYRNNFAYTHVFCVVYWLHFFFVKMVQFRTH